MEQNLTQHRPEPDRVPFIERLPNGLTVVVEQMPGVESVAYDFCIPGGLIYEREEQQGSVLALAELIARGAGGLDAKQLSDSFDRLGARHSESAGTESFSFRAVCLSSEFEECLRLTSLQVLDPLLPENELEPIKSLLLQDIKSLPDNPARRVMHELYSGYMPAPFNRSSLGTIEGINNCCLNTLKTLHTGFFTPQNAILSIAGKIDPQRVVKLASELFKDWNGQKLEPPAFGKVVCPAVRHIESDSAQIQIALAYPSAKFGDQDYYAAKVASAILSGGMFGRVFVEVREKRGLVYSVSARHISNKHCGYILAYAGTTPDRAQETLDVLSAELQNFSKSVSPEELSRARTYIKSSLVLGDESTSSRAVSNGHDLWLSGRIRPFSEIMHKIDSVTSEDIVQFCQNFPADKFYLTTLGSKALQIKADETSN